MAISTQHNPNGALNQRLTDVGASKTVYALVTPETEAVKAAILGNQMREGVDQERAAYLEQFRDAWTGKQEEHHRTFFDVWHQWSSPLVDLDRALFPYAYPTAGASEPLRHLIFDYGNQARDEGFMPRIHVFKGEYEGYKAYAEAAHIEIIEHDRRDWRMLAENLPENEWFFLSQPSAIDGRVWAEANAFLHVISTKSQKPRVVMDMTYVGAIPEAPSEKFSLTEPCIRNVVFSLSKPFGVYYDRIGGIFCREQDMGLFGNMWFKSLMALQLGTALMQGHDVFDLPRRYRPIQIQQAEYVSRMLGIQFHPSDVYLLATDSGEEKRATELTSYLRRPASDPGASLRICLTPGMAKAIGTAGPVRHLQALPALDHMRPA